MPTQRTRQIPILFPDQMSTVMPDEREPSWWRQRSKTSLLLLSFSCCIQNGVGTTILHAVLMLDARFMPKILFWEAKKGDERQEAVFSLERMKNEKSENGEK